jgi:CDP-diacylglycerol---glycerol-3-phosphate 3-phosphatidyltransferase
VNAANWLSLIRLLLTLPIIVCLYYPGMAWWALGLFIFAMLTDVFDGPLARRDPNRSALGAYLDPVADKVLITTLFIILAHERAFPLWIPVVFVFREFVVSGVRAAGAAQGKVIGSNWMGKTKTFLQTAALCVSLWATAIERGSPGDIERFQNLYEISYWIAAVAAIASVIFAGVFVYWNRAILRHRPPAMPDSSAVG